MSDINTLTVELARLSRLAALAAQHLGDPTGQKPAQGLALLLAVHDRLVQHPQAPQRALPTSAGVLRDPKEQLLDRVRRRRWG